MSEAQQPDPSNWRIDRLAWLISVAIVVATLLNGLPFYLRRIGWIDREAYRHDLMRFCLEPINHWWLPATCHYRRVLDVDPLRVISVNISRFYELSTPELFLKLAKYGVTAGLLGVSLLLVLRGQASVPSFLRLRPAWPMLAATLISLALGFIQGGGMQALLIVVNSAWLWVLLFSSWLTTPSRLQTIVDGISILILLQLPLALMEAMRGIPTPFGPGLETLDPPSLPVPSRLMQVFVQPNSLGGFLVVGLGFCIAFSRRRRWLPWLMVAVLPPLLLSRSATGLLAMTVMVILWPRQPFSSISGRGHRPRSPWALRNRWSRSVLSVVERRKILLLLILAIPAALLLPTALDRPDLFDSLMGRWLTLRRALDGDQPMNLLLGRGVGNVGSLFHNIVATNHASLAWFKAWPVFNNQSIATDSQVVMILVQGGLLGVVGFFTLLLGALNRAAWALPFLLAVALCSLTLNITDIFPLSILLGLGLNRCLLGPRGADVNSSSEA